VKPAGPKTAGDDLNGRFHKNFTQHFKFFRSPPGRLAAAKKAMQ